MRPFSRMASSTSNPDCAEMMTTRRLGLELRGQTAAHHGPPGVRAAADLVGHSRASSWIMSAVNAMFLFLVSASPCTR